MTDKISQLQCLNCGSGNMTAVCLIGDRSILLHCLGCGYVLQLDFKGSVGKEVREKRIPGGIG